MLSRYTLIDKEPGDVVMERPYSFMVARGVWNKRPKCLLWAFYQAILEYHLKLFLFVVDSRSGRLKSRILEVLIKHKYNYIVMDKIHIMLS